MIDLSRARRETPGCQHVTHFNNAGAALMPEPVLATMLDYLQLEAQIGGYEAADQMAAELNGFHDVTASLLNCRPDEIAFAENATRAWDMAFYAIPLAAGDRILTSSASYGSNYLALLQRARQVGAHIEVIPNDESGQLSLPALRDMLDERVKLIELTHMPTNGGLVNPAAAVGQLAREAGVFYRLDACQSVGQMTLDVSAIGCDFLSATGRKYLRGPRGTGFLYVHRERLAELEPPFIDIRAAD
jgi:cysteine desulfurase / selenocysteine lyase